MDDSHLQPRPRASLRGKGREILLGRRRDAESAADPLSADAPLPPAPDPKPVDPSALALTPEETHLLLDFSPTSPVYQPAPKLPTAVDSDSSMLDWMVTVPEPVGQPADRVRPSELERPPVSSVAEPSGSDAPSNPVGVDQVPDPASAASAENWWDQAFDQPPEEESISTAEPLHAESGAASEAEVSPELEPRSETSVPRSAAPTGAASPPAPEARSPVRHEGGLVVPEEAVMEPLLPTAVDDSLAPAVRRQPPRALLSTTAAPDPRLLETLVDDDRLKELWRQIDALHEELINRVRGGRGTTDVYQQELLQASSMLLESRANYNEARAIVYRIRADLNRQRRVAADVSRYRPLLLNYYVGWVIALGVLVMLKSLFTGVAEAVGIRLLAAMYYPMLAGVVGALISGYLTLDRHTTKLRDFDPVHISWYLFNPLLGGAMGLVMFFLASIANEDLLSNTASPLENAIVWLLCIVAGMNQGGVLRPLNDLWKRFRRG